MCFRSCDIGDDTKQHSALSGSKITYPHTLSSITHTHRAVCSLVKLHKHWISVYVITCDGFPLSNTHCHQSQTHTCSHTLPAQNYLLYSLFSPFCIPLSLSLTFISFHKCFCHALRPFGNFTVNISLVSLFHSHQVHIFSLFFSFPPAPSFSFSLLFLSASLFMWSCRRRHGWPAREFWELRFQSSITLLVSHSGSPATGFY